MSSSCTEEDAIRELCIRIQNRFSHNDIRDIYRIITINITSLYNVCMGSMLTIHMVGQSFIPTVYMFQSVFRKSSECITIKRGNRRVVFPRSVGIVLFHNLSPIKITSPVVNVGVRSRVVSYLPGRVRKSDTVSRRPLPRMSTEYHVVSPCDSR